MTMSFSALVEKRPGHTDANACFDPWIDVANEWARTSDVQIIRRSIVTVRGTEGEIMSEMEMFLPVDTPAIPDTRLYWDAKHELTVSITMIDSSDPVDEDDIKQGQADTRTMFDAAYGWRFPIEQSRFVVIFSVLAARKAQDRPLFGQTQLSLLRPKVDLIQWKTENNRPFIFEEWLENKPPADAVRHLYEDFEDVPANMAHVALSKLPKNVDFLHKLQSNAQQSSEKKFSYLLPETVCTISDVSYPVVQFAMLMPSIMHRLEVYMIASALESTVLASVKFSSLQLVAAAISASSALEETNYQRLEFVGDSLLKICTSLQLMAEHPIWDEGNLSRKKDHIVSNSRLAKAAMNVGLDRFIITKRVTGRRWRPLYMQNLTDAASKSAKREMSTKVLADVVEALIGAAYIDGGMSKVFLCLKVFLPEIVWHTLDTSRTILFEIAPVDMMLPPPMKPLEQLIGYSFKKKVLLVEAMTHASCSIGTASLGRWEYLGDAVLDNLIVHITCNQAVELSHVQMHHLRIAFVNADFLAFMCMEWAIEQETCSVTEDIVTHSFLPLAGTRSLALWKFMLWSSQIITRLQNVTAMRHLELRHEINEALQSGSHYPWKLLCQLQAPKFFSDILESLLGAVYIDSGSLDACQKVIERMGISAHLHRVIRDQVNILHPTEELGILATAEKVRYVIGVEKAIVGGREQKRYVGKVYLGDRCIVQVSDGLNPEEVKTKAAEAAVQILKGRSDSHVKPASDAMDTRW